MIMKNLEKKPHFFLNTLYIKDLFFKEYVFRRSPNVIIILNSYIIETLNLIVSLQVNEFSKKSVKELMVLIKNLIIRRKS